MAKTQGSSSVIWEVIRFQQNLPVKISLSFCICSRVSGDRCTCTKVQVWRSEDHLAKSILSFHHGTQVLSWGCQACKANALISKMSYWLQLRLLRISNYTKVSHKQGNQLSTLTGSKYITRFSSLHIITVSIHTPDYIGHLQYKSIVVVNKIKIRVNKQKLMNLPVSHFIVLCVNTSTVCSELPCTASILSYI